MATTKTAVARRERRRYFDLLYCSRVSESHLVLQSNASPKASKKAKTASSSKSKKGKAKADDDEDKDTVLIQMNSHVSLTFSLKYLVSFSKSGNLTGRVELFMSNDVPLLVRGENLTVYKH